MTHRFSLEGRVALVTGAGSGLGRAIAEGMAADGAKVVIVDMNEAGLWEVASAHGNSCIPLPADVRDERAAERAAALAVETFGRLDILVNCAGITRNGPLLEMSDADWRDVLDIHLTGSMLWSRQAAKAMIAGGRGGKIINIGSMASLFAAPMAVNYAVAKSGMIGLTRTLAVELASHNIQANAILPGWFVTPMTSVEMREGPRGQQISRRTPAGRWGLPPEIYGTAAFFASSASDFVTGTALAVDGGFSVTLMASE